jgi:hypothetical protein
MPEKVGVGNLVESFHRIPLGIQILEVFGSNLATFCRKCALMNCIQRVPYQGFNRFRQSGTSNILPLLANILAKNASTELSDGSTPKTVAFMFPGQGGK